MNDDRHPVPARVPTLTEVVLEAASAPVATSAAAPAPPALDEVVRQVLADLQPRVDLMFEYRVREALTPLMQELAQQIVERARVELGHSLRDVVARAVAHELERRNSAAES